MLLAATLYLKPSRMILIATAAMTVMAAIAVGQIGIAFAMLGRVLIGTSFVTLAAIAWVQFLNNRREYRLDIAESGALILRHQLSHGQYSVAHQVRLLAKSTLWEHLFVLHFAPEDGRAIVIVVAPDSLNAESFRKLAIALRWLAAHRENSHKKEFDQGNF